MWGPATSGAMAARRLLAARVVTRPPRWTRRAGAVSLPRPIVAAAIVVPSPRWLSSAVAVRRPIPLVGAIALRRPIGSRSSSEPAWTNWPGASRRSGRPVAARRAREWPRLERALGFHRPFRPIAFLAAVRWRRPFAPLILRKAPPSLVARHLEAIARILVLSTWPPLTRTPIGWRGTARSALRHHIGAFFVLRSPQASAREPLHHRIRMPHLQLPQRRQQFLLGVRAKCGRLAFENNRPVVVPGGHGSADYGSFDSAAGGSRRFSFSISVVRLRLSSFAACRLFPRVRSRDRRISESSTPSM
jgi:hypothetical protein